MKRRQFLKQSGLMTLGTIAAAVGASGLGLSCLSKGKTRKPNIIYILADDLGYGDLGCYGQQIIKTPNLDKMASDGIRFTDHYAGSTVCAPSRCTLMTGLHTGHARVRGNYETGPHGFGACLELRPQDTTIAEFLKPAGYRTGLFGKWGLGVKTTTGEPGKKGFDEWFGYLNQGHAHFYYPEFLWKNGEKVVFEGNKNGKRQQYAHDLITEETLNFVKNNKDNPFFVYLAYTIPHAELLVPEDSMNEYEGQFKETAYVNNGSGGMGGYASQDKPKAAFAGMVSRMDRDIGKLMELLKELGIDDDTIVMFSSDNGPHLEGGAEPDFFDSNGPLRGYKRDLYEGGIRVPFIVRWPGKIKPGRVSGHISAFWDVLPTACDIAGVTVPENVDGLSFLSELLGREQPEHEYLYWEFHENKTTDQAVRMGNWKAVRHSPGSPVELYDLSKDKSEINNIADRHSEIVEKFRKLFAQARTPHEIWPLK